MASSGTISGSSEWAHDPVQCVPRCVSESFTGLEPLTSEPTPDADLAAVIEAWPTLPDATKTGILAMVRAANDKD